MVSRLPLQSDEQTDEPECSKQSREVDRQLFAPGYP